MPDIKIGKPFARRATITATAAYVMVLWALEIFSESSCAMTYIYAAHVTITTEMAIKIKNIALKSGHMTLLIRVLVSVTAAAAAYTNFE